jgi:hypothetical protein
MSFNSKIILQIESVMIMMQSYNGVNIDNVDLTLVEKYWFEYIDETKVEFWQTY